MLVYFFFFQAEDGIRDLVRSRGLGDVYKRQDTYRGEAPKAFIKLKSGMTATQADIMRHLEEKISKIELPAEIEFRDALPKTMIGKLSKKELVAEELAKRGQKAVSYTHLRAHETVLDLVCRLLLEKKTKYHTDENNTLEPLN